MKRRLIRTVVAAATTLGLAAGVNLITTGTAQAVSSTWSCMTVSPLEGGLAYGWTCHGIGEGTGWLQVYVGGGEYQTVYRCYLTATEVFDPPANPYWNVSGTSCITA